MTDHPRSEPFRSPPPGGHHAETNEEALARAVAEQEALYPHPHDALPGEPGRRRGFVTRLVTWIAAAALAGAIAGLAVSLALGAGAGQAVLWAVSLAIVLACTVPLVVTEEEDGWRRRAIFDRARRRQGDDR